MRFLNIFLALVVAIFFLACGADTNVSTGGSGAVAVQGGGNDQTITIKEDDSVAKGSEAAQSSMGRGNGSTQASDNFINLESSGIKSVLFAFDRYDVSPNDPRINAVAQMLLDTGSKVVLEGNTDSFGSDEYNYALGKKRADAVKRVLVQKGVNAANISTITYGESKPVCMQDTQECYQANRRVDFKIAQ